MVSEHAPTCPNCGAPQPAKREWTGYGYEYKSKIQAFGLPLIHVSFKYSPNRMPVVAKGVIAIGQFSIGYLSIGQFAVGIFTVAQFGIGLMTLAQFAIGVYVVAQFAFGYTGIGLFSFFLESLLLR